MKRMFAWILLAALVLCGCQKAPEDYSDKVGYVPETQGTMDPVEFEETPRPVAEEGQLTAIVDTREEAEEIGTLYGIELKSYDFGVAVYYTEEDPKAVIQRGLENGWAELSLNDVLSLG